MASHDFCSNPRCRTCHAEQVADRKGARIKIWRDTITVLLLLEPMRRKHSSTLDTVIMALETKILLEETT